MERAKKRKMFFLQKLISRKNGASGEAIFFLKWKKRNTDVIFRLEKNIGVSKEKWSGKIKN